MKTKALPKSKAKTAYGLLSEVRRLILEEPKRYDQGAFICRIGGKGRSWDLDPEQAPACGTVGANYSEGTPCIRSRGQRSGKRWNTPRLGLSTSRVFSKHTPSN